MQKSLPEGLSSSGKCKTKGVSVEESVKRLADECFSLGAQLEELSDDLSALNNDIRRTKMQVEELFAQSQQSELL